MHKNLVLRSQRNLILQLIQETELTPSEFSWAEVSSTQSPPMLISRLDHAPTGFYFLFDYLQEKHWVRFSPGKESLVETRYSGDWPNELQAVMRWLDYLKLEHQSPDLWAMIEQERQLMLSATSTDIDNAPFSVEEQRRISTAVNELRAYVQVTANLTQAQLEFVSDRLSHLEESAGRLGRKDWITLAIGALTNVIVGVALAPDAARDLLRTANGLLGWVVKSLSTVALQ